MPTQVYHGGEQEIPTGNLHALVGPERSLLSHLRRFVYLFWGSATVWPGPRNKFHLSIPSVVQCRS